MHISLAKSAILAPKKQRMLIIYDYLFSLFQVLIFIFLSLIVRELIGMTKGGLLCFNAFEKQRQRFPAVSSREFQFLQLPYSFIPFLMLN